MWKYVSRRVRDSFECTYNVLEYRRTWTCGERGTTTANNNNSGNSSNSTSSSCAEDANDPQRRSAVLVPAEKPFLCLVPFYKTHDRHKSKDDFRRQHCEFEAKQNILGALKWSGAIVCGWYASQILCNRRRHHMHRDAFARAHCRHSRTLTTPSRAFHSSCLSHWLENQVDDAKKPSLPPTWSTQPLDVVDGPRKQQQPQTAAEVFPINNDLLYDGGHLPSKGSSTNTIQPLAAVASSSATVDSAVHDLLQVVGDIEFQLGVRHLNDDHFDVAVAHFKLATSHNHSGATYNLGLCYELGMGVEQNARMALQCYSVAAEMGHPGALYNLAVYHGRGLGGLAKSRKTGRRYLEAAARLGQMDAVRALGWRSDDVARSPTFAGGLDMQASPKQNRLTSDFLRAVSVA